MKFTQSTFRKSLILMGLFTSFTVSTTVSAADTSSTFDYNNNKTSTNYVDSRTSGGDLFSKGYYVGGSIGQSEGSSYCSGSSTCEDSDTAWKIFGGMQVMDKLSVEGSYLNLGDIRKDGQN